MKKSPQIVFFGTEDFSAVSLEALIEAGFSVKAIVTKPDSPSGRGQQLSPPLVKTIGQSHGIEILQPENLLEIKDFVLGLDNPAGVLVSYGKIIPLEIIELFELGIINLHPSLLPKYRGPSPIETAILNGDEQTGVSIMRLVEKMDAGPVYLQQKVDLKTNDTKPQLYAHLASVGAAGLARALPLIWSGRLQDHPQNHQAASYTKLLSKEMSLINPEATTADQAERQVKAFLGFPRSRVRLFEKDYIVTKAHVSTVEDSFKPSLLCSDSQFLVVDKLIAPSGKEMDSQDFLRGYR